MGSGPSLALTVCPLTGVPFVDPVKAADGHTYERRSLEQWIETCKNTTGLVVSPLTHEPMDDTISFERDMDAYNAVKEAFADHMVLGKAPEAASARTLQGQITSVYDLNRAFELVDSMRDMLINVLHRWQPPKLVVVGEESSGKSTLLERLLMMSLFPRADGVCTRARIQVRLRHTDRSSMPRLSVVHADTGEILRGPHVIAAENGHINVSEEMGRLVEEDEAQNGVSSKCMICLEIDGPHLPSIDLVDLPGLVQAPKAAAEATRALVDAQISQHRQYSLFLAIVPAGRRPTSSAAMRVVEDHGLQDKTLGVFTHCDELAPGKHATLRRWLERPDEFGYQDTHYPLKPYGWVATSNPPVDDKTMGNKVSHGSLLRLQQQAQNEVSFFEAKSMHDLMEKNLAGTGAVQNRLNTMFSEYLLRTWAPFTIFKLNRESERLKFDVAVLGSPPADAFISTPELQALKFKAVTAASQALREDVPAIAKTLAKEVLTPLRESLVALIGSEISCPTDQLNEQWYGLQAELTNVCREAAYKAPQHFRVCVQAAMERDPIHPPWPSVAGEEVVKSPPFILSRFPIFIKLVVNRMEGLLTPWRDNLVTNMNICIDKIFEVGSPWVKFRTRLQAEPPMMRVRCSSEDVIGAIFAGFLRHSVASFIEQLIKVLPEVAYNVPEWIEPTVAAREKILLKVKDIDRVRSELLKLLGSTSKGPEGLANLEKISLARCNCRGVGVSYAWASQPSKIWIRARDHEGSQCRLPADSLFDVSLLGPGDEPSFVLPVKLEGNKQGVYGGSYRIPEEHIGRQSLERMSLSVALHGCPIAGSPFNLLASYEPVWESSLMVHCQGKGTGELQTAADVAVDEKYVYIADIDRHCIYLYGNKDSEMRGKFVGVFGSEESAFGSEEGVDWKVKSPWGLVVDNNDVFVVDNEENVVKVFSKHDGSFLYTFGEGELKSPKGLVVEDDCAYVVDSGNNRVKVFTRQKNNRVVPSGNIGFAGIGSGQLNNPICVAVDGDSLHVVDQGNRRIQVFNKKDFGFIRSYGHKASSGSGFSIMGNSPEGGLREPLGIAVGGPFVYVADAGNHCLQVFDKEDGAFIKAVGSRGAAIGELREPGCIAIYGEDIYVSEIANNRVQAFRYKVASKGNSET